MERNMLIQDLDLSWDDFVITTSSKTVNNAKDAMVCSLNDKGIIDIEYMSEISGLSMVSIIEDLNGYIFQDPNDWNECYYKGFKSKDEYLSGDIYTKLKLAKEANIKYGVFTNNIKALEEVLPKKLPYKEIHYSIASSWMNKDIIKNFINTL